MICNKNITFIQNQVRHLYELLIWGKFIYRSESNRVLMVLIDLMTKNRNKISTYVFIRNKPKSFGLYHDGRNSTLFHFKL